MFERYTERARRVIFFARFEASRLGTLEITPEHLLLALLREDDSLRRLLPAASAEQIRRTVDSEGRHGEKISTSVDLPLSRSSKRVLTYAAEESERLDHGAIRPAHLTIGLLRERSRAAEILEAHGVTLDRARQEASVVPVADEAPEAGSPGAAASRERIHELVDILPESALAHALSLLLHLREAGAQQARFAQARARIMESLRTQAAAGGAAVTFPGGTPAWLHVREGETVIESHRIHHDHEIWLTERLRLSDDSKTLHYSIEARGPKGTHTWSGDFDVSAAPS